MAIETKPTGIIGVKGLKSLGGYIQEEYLAALKSWAKEVKIYLEMRDDLIVSVLLDAVKLPLLAAEFDVVKLGENPVDDEAADFLWDNLRNMEAQTWRKHVADALDALDFGFNISEIILEKRQDGRMWLKNLEPRGQETLEKWEFDETDKAITYQQRDPDTGKLIAIPLEKCVHITFRGRKGNPQGRSALRSCFRAWRYLRNMEELEGIGVERDVGGMPIAKLPQEGLSDTQIELVKTALKGLRVDEEMFLLLPYGMEIVPYASGSKQYDVGAIIERKKKEILMRFFAQFLMLGMEKVGTQALVKGSQDFFSLGLIAVQQELLEAWNQQLVPYLFRYNEFPGLTGLPQLTWADPGKADIGGLLDGYTKGVASGLITVLREDEEHVRTVMGLPDLPEGEGEGVRLPIEQAPTPGLFGK